ncbi:hypothetical protein PLICRDRAFT_532583 [Plicaturopsis crispa FD-325 SS-3]|nr:hypothetical protein PLICRDRAFT_532583 [Plicaturopsis crispa FD-325 SS-3]
MTLQPNGLNGLRIYGHERDLASTPTWFVCRGHRVTHAGTVQQIVAKVFRTPGDGGLQQRLLERQELQGILGHPNIGFLDELRFQGPAPIIIERFYQNGNILQYIRNVNMPVEGRVTLMKDATRGLEYLHSEGIIHGQIHGSNILIDDSGNAVLCDAGMNSVVYAAQVSTPMSRVCFWQAPEILSREDDGAPQATIAADMYALGCTAKEIFTLKRPFPKIKSPHVLVFKMWKGQLTDADRTSGIPPGVIDALEGCWAADPADRPSTRTVRQRLEVIGI